MHATMLYFLCFIILASFVCDNASASSQTLRRSRRSFFQFGLMVSCTTGRNPVDYTDYGCFCGLGGEGQPIDALDECCKVHDECYGAVENMIDRKTKEQCGNPIIGISYTWKSKCKKNKIKCKGKRGTCQRAACECDKKAALCFANSVYIDDHWDIDLDRCTMK